MLEAEISGTGVQRPQKAVAADFSRQEWEKEWLFIGSPTEGNYVRGNGELLLRPSEKRLPDGHTGVTFAAMRQPDFSCEIRASLVCGGTDLRAGLAVYLEPGFLYRIYKSCEPDGDYVVAERFVEDIYVQAYREKAAGGTVEFTIKADKSGYEFFYTINGDTVLAMKGSARFLCTGMANRCFTGTVAGVFAEGAETETAQVRSFVMTPEREMI